MQSCHGTGRHNPPVVIVRKPADSTSGAWSWKRSTMHWRSRNLGIVRSMMKKPLLEAIRERPLLCDGAMGTQLMIAGLEQGNCGEEWNVTHPEKVLAIQRAYTTAGSDCIITNTFGGSRI